MKDTLPLGHSAQIEALNSIISADSVTEAWRVFGDAMAHLGLLYLFFGQARHPGPPNPIDPAEALILHRIPSQWVDAYVDEQLYKGNPLFDWVQHNDGFISVADVVASYDGPVTKQMARLMELRHLHEAGPGFLGGMRDLIPGVTAGMTLSFDNTVSPEEAEARWAGCAATVAVMARALHLRVSTLPQPLLRPLSSRQREVLEWSSQGKTVRDIATIMEVEATTVEKHLRLAREALNASNTSHAVRKALTLNLLSV